MLRSLVSVLFFVGILASTQTRAFNCSPGQSPFTDVPDAAIFCTEALWLRNAMVTFGCGNGTVYCPGDNVTRAQMALFMNRLARAIVQDVETVESAALAGDLDSGGVTTCVSQPYAIAPQANGRLIGHAHASLSLQTSASADLIVGIEMSTNGGVFAFLGGMTSQSVFVPVANQWTSFSLMAGSGVRDGQGAKLFPGNTYQWRVKLLRAGPGTTGEPTLVRCQLKIELPRDPFPV